MSEQADNPYASPTTDSAATSGADGHAAPKRPVSPKVFGVLSIIFAVLGVLSGIVNVLVNFNSPQQQEIINQLGYSTRYLIITQVIGFFVALCLLWIGVALVNYKNAGRIGFNIYAWLTILSTIGNSIYSAIMIYRAFGDDNATSNAILIGGIVGGIIGSAISLLFPILGLVLLNREAVKQHLK